MKCPRTGVDLKPVNIGGITVDISEKCGGVFFDHDEIEKFDEKTKIRGGLLVQHLKQFTPPPLNLNKHVNCPKCTGTVMDRSFYSSKNKIEVDKCPSCAGIWFDFGELEKLRNLIPVSNGSYKSGRQFEEQLLNSPAYQEYKSALDDNADDTARREKADQLHLFLFNCIY
ncbi:zf-TFIIB domain-containing protein [Psychromonas ossibalaenae]|uniref:TFIIB-type zinc ribbon-containing protein n=1 Tax=Psychromonas ossibalaenae TaxID=444922 RepID=UPI00035DA649|nr:zf-TFIIB domain-containing protein [Psychromonas ossibalaenae]